MSDHSVTGRECEAWARENPDDPEPVDALWDAASDWAAGGDHGRALALYQQIQRGDRSGFGVVGAYIAEELFALGREADARAVIARTRGELDAADQPDGDGYGLMADLLDDRGETDAALEWCQAGIARYCPRYQPEVLGEDGYDATSAHLLATRRMLRQQLDLAPDALDVAVDAVAERTLATLRKVVSGFAGRTVKRPGDGAFTGMSLYWSEPDFVAARARWPLLAVDYGEDYPAYCRRVEDNARAVSETGHLRLGLVRDSLEGYERYAQRTKQAPEDPVTRQEYGRWFAGQHLGEWVAWPPPRNGGCWCGSGAKYKKCCGSTARR